MTHARQIAATLALCLTAATPAALRAQDCPNCATELTLTPAQAECFLANLSLIRDRAEVRPPALVDFSICERADGATGNTPLAADEPTRGGDPDLLPLRNEQHGNTSPGCTEDCPEPARFAFLTTRQIDCLTARVRDGGVSAPAATIDLTTCP